jgi:hypothetical protein
MIPELASLPQTLPRQAVPIEEWIATRIGREHSLYFTHQPSVAAASPFDKGNAIDSGIV